MICLKCKIGEVRLMAKVFVDIPADWRDLSKSGFRSKVVRVDGVDWSGPTYCTNPNCSNVTTAKL